MGYQPRAVWKQVKSVFLSAVKIPPVLAACDAQITWGLEIETIDPAHPIGKTVESLRHGMLRTLARLASAAMQSMQAAEGKRKQAFTFAKKLDDLLEKHQEKEQALSDVS